MTEPLTPIPLAEIEAARARLRGVALRTPLVRLESPEDSPRIFLKLENLQPIGSFKLRGAANAMALAGSEALARGVYTASAGNMAQGVAWCAREMGVRCTVIVPERAPETKIAAIERLGGTVIKVPFDAWWQTMLDHRYPGIDGLFVHPFADAAVMAGNGTIGLEILEDAPEVDAIVVPFGGGGLACGIASAVRASAVPASTGQASSVQAVRASAVRASAVQASAGQASAVRASAVRAVRPSVRVYAAEVETAAPFSASLALGQATSVTPTPSFVDGIGGRSVFEEMWPLTHDLLVGSVVVSVAAIASAVRLLAERSRIVAEGAGAASVAAALSGAVEARTIVCVVSGGNIDSGVLAAILNGETPAAGPPHQARRTRQTLASQT
jgi:threonine dehydratase